MRPGSAVLYYFTLSNARRFYPYLRYIAYFLNVSINQVHQLRYIAYFLNVSINQIDIVCITETWLSSTIPDSAISLPNFNVIRNYRCSSCGVGVCIFINNNIYCQCLTAFEDSTVEYLWLLIRPTWLPRSTSVILLAVIYHSTSAGHTEN